MFNKTNIWAIIALIFVCMISYIFIQEKRLKTIKNDYSNAVNNVNSLIYSNGEYEKGNRALKLTIEQLNNYNDSITLKLKETIKENKIKDKNIKQLQYQLSHSHRVDTIVTRDTIFKEGVRVDTTLQDRWYRLDVVAEYPSTLVVSPTFFDEYRTIFHYSKETINPRKKFFLWRWFQRKHFVTNTTITNSNPYCKIDTMRVIEIVK